MAPATARNIADIAKSADLWKANDTAAAALLASRHRYAQETCDTAKGKQTLQTGGWCLQKMVRDRLFGNERTVNTSDGAMTYRLPASHVPADLVLVDGILNITDGCRLSVNDFGAGVGQYGHEIQRQGCRWTGYDGAGDVEMYTNGFVRFADMTVRLALPRADWVVSFEVGEHVPRAHQMALIRNMHAHNRCGVLLSWACCNNGHQHINLHSNRWVTDVFERLGYVYDAPRSDAMRNTRLRDRLRPTERTSRVYGWFATSVMLFVRKQPLISRSGADADLPQAHCEPRGMPSRIRLRAPTVR